MPAPPGPALASAACRAPACSRQRQPQQSPAFAFVLIVTSSGRQRLRPRPRPSRLGGPSARRPAAPSARPGPACPRRGPIKAGFAWTTCATASLTSPPTSSRLTFSSTLDLLAKLGGKSRRIGRRADPGQRQRLADPDRGLLARRSPEADQPPRELDLPLKLVDRWPPVSTSGYAVWWTLSGALSDRPSAPDSGTSPPRRTAGTAPARSVSVVSTS